MKPRHAIRKANENDFGKLLGFLMLVDTDFYPPLSERGPIEEKARKMLTAKGQHCLIMEDRKGIAIAFAGFMENYKERKGVAFINFLSVHPKHRKKGIAVFLRKEALSILKKDGMREVHSRTWSTNTPMVKINEKMGFKVERVLKNARGPGVDSIFFKKKL